MGSRELVFALCIASAPGAIGACAVGQAESDTPFDAGQPSADGASNPMLDGSTEQAAMPESAPPVIDTGSGPTQEAAAPEASAPETGVPEATVPEATVPEAAVPEATVPEATVPDAPTSADTGVPETSTDVCVPAAATETLPFAVDTLAKYIPSGWEGDMSELMMPTDATCGGNRSSSSAQGNCHPVIYTPLPAGGAILGWAGVLWQHPLNNWGTAAGYPIPAGASKVSFWARGQAGGEVVNFLAGFAVTPTPTNPCFDDVAGSLPNQTLTTTWAHYTMPLSTQSYGPGVIVSFGFTVAAAAQPVRNAGAGDASAPSPVTFFIDDIEWQQ